MGELDKDGDDEEEELSEEKLIQPKEKRHLVQRRYKT